MSLDSEGIMPAVGELIHSHDGSDLYLEYLMLSAGLKARIIRLSNELGELKHQQELSVSLAENYDRARYAVLMELRQQQMEIYQALNQGYLDGTYDAEEISNLFVDLGARLNEIVFIAYLNGPELITEILKVLAVDKAKTGAKWLRKATVELVISEFSKAGIVIPIDQWDQLQYAIG